MSTFRDTNRLRTLVLAGLGVKARRTRLRLVLRSTHIGPLPAALVQAVASVVRRCWKHSRQNTGRPCVGLKGTVVSLPHCEHTAEVSTLPGPAARSPPFCRLALQLRQRFGSFLKSF